MDFAIISKLFNYEFISSEFQRVTADITWTNVSTVQSQIFVIAVILLFILHQLVLQRASEKEVENILGQCRQGQARVMNISHFKKDIANLFSIIEPKSKQLHTRYKRTESIVSKPDEYDNLRQDFHSIKKNWAKEFAFISRFNIGYLNGRKTSDIKIQLTMAKGFVDKELGIIKKDMAEDMLSLQEVEREVRTLQKYFGK
ncbi:uncharacterized protein LOC127728145 [Mytilus californianus]|uniref:uncharacterized protein LOC127728145 n=1 Tax=Mytilus californianus TaxID=6549 RepID=UPI0022456B92|nr:uncharacterized protein LOC127728145 [Mytilus californianus]